MDLGVLLFALLLGLGANLFCMGACLPVLAPYVMGKARKSKGITGGARLGAWFTLGRLPLYLALGAAVALTGRGIMEGAALHATIAMRLALGAVLIAYGAVAAFGLKAPGPCAVLFRGNAFAVAAGFLVGSVACPPLAILLAELFLGGDPAAALAAVFVFWAASSVLTLAAAAASGGAAEAINRRWEKGRLREVSGWVLIMVGILQIWMVAMIFA